MNPVVCWHSVKSQLFCSLLFRPLRLAAFLWSTLYLQLPALWLSVRLSIKVINTFPSLHTHTELSFNLQQSVSTLQCTFITRLTWSRNTWRPKQQPAARTSVCSTWCESQSGVPYLDVSVTSGFSADLNVVCWQSKEENVSADEQEVWRCSIYIQYYTISRHIVN